MIIRGEQVLLRFIEPDDLEDIRGMTNDADQEFMIGGWSFPTAKKHQEEWYQRVLVDRNNLRLAIEFEGSFVGLVTLTDIDWKNSKAESGIRLTLNAPKQKGIATDALKALLKYAFEELNLQRVYATVLEHNLASKKLHDKCGYVVEGTLRKSIYKRGSYHSVYVMGFLKEEYLKKYNNVQSI